MKFVMKMNYENHKNCYTVNLDPNIVSLQMQMILKSMICKFLILIYGKIDTYSESQWECQNNRFRQNNLS